MQKMTVVVHSGELDKIMSALIIGNGFLAMGGEVTLFFTFWGLRGLMKGGLKKAPLSKMNWGGIGSWMMRRKMKQKKVAPAERLMEDFRELGGRVVACEMTMEIMGLSREKLRGEWIDDYGTVGVYVQETLKADRTLFI
ncbi:DsrE/DsrF/DrsH-like family protein [bacterium]|nr:DsrE/DsrF/DrsH-like family protein [bacterium]